MIDVGGALLFRSIGVTGAAMIAGGATVLSCLGLKKLTKYLDRRMQQQDPSAWKTTALKMTSLMISIVNVFLTVVGLGVTVSVAMIDPVVLGLTVISVVFAAFVIGLSSSRPAFAAGLP